MRSGHLFIALLHKTSVIRNESLYNERSEVFGPNQ
jgi:hypothetical protein